MKTVLKLGTRKSLLAWAQSGQVARQVEKNNPGIKVELVGIETRGDRILDVPLRKVEGKEFFVAEIDQALRSKEVDFTVHSLKDLSLDRPGDFFLGAIPERKNPRDIILFSSHILDRIQRGETLKIGTSAPRRLENIPNFLTRALPQIGNPKLEFIEIRGNVNTRLSRVHEDLSSERYLDGVVLAFAGLIRLWEDLSGKGELSKLLRGVRWMILPLKECPSAPGQGALAVECRAEDKEVQDLLGKIHHKQTEQHVSSERKLLLTSGGGCHQRFGATAIDHSELGSLLFIRGKDSSGNEMNELRWTSNAPLPQKDSPIRPWNGGDWKAASYEVLETNEIHENAIFVAHSRALLGLDLSFFRTKKIWASGVESWFKLASLGLWVEGCAEGLGFESLVAQLREPVLDLPQLKNWAVLTHSEAQAGWEKYGSRVISRYKINLDYGRESKSSIQAATHVFWSSGSQYIRLREWVNSKAIHFCGPGKTAGCLRENGIQPWVFPTAEDWKKWIKTLKQRPL